MKSFFYALAIIYFLIPFPSCTDILEPDLTTERISLITPEDNYSTNVQTVRFEWEELDNALTYRLQIAPLSFDAPLPLALDTSLAINSFTHTLSQGDYQWRVIGENTNTFTEFEVFQLTINEDSTLNNQLINLVSPANGSAMNTSNVTFLWQELDAANHYRIQCATPDFSNSTFILFNDTTSSDSYTASLPDGNYQWRIRAENDFDETAYSEQTLIIDTEAPTPPILNIPADGAIDYSPVLLEWTSDADAIQDTIYIYQDSLVTLFEKSAVTGMIYSFDNGSIDSTYFWQVRSVDQAGNASELSEAWRFTVN